MKVTTAKKQKNKGEPKDYSLSLWVHPLFYTVTNLPITKTS